MQPCHSNFNMKAITQLSILAMIAFVNQSCQKEIDLKLDEYQPKLAISSLFEQDSNFYFSIAESQSVLDNDTFPPLENVSILLTNSLGESETISALVDHTFYYQNKRVYKSNMRAREGLTYDISVSHPNHKTATATAGIPDGVQITSLDTQTVLEFGYPALRINMIFQDPVVTNYYELKLFAYAPEIVYDKQTWEAIDTIMSFQEMYYSFPSDGLLDNGGNSIFSDELFNGKEYTLSFNTDKSYIDYLLEGKEAFPEAEIFLLPELRSISKEYYDYQTSMVKYWNADGNPFAQPVQVYTNIENGFGIFAGFGKSNDTIWLD
jgi:hypothetical protein